MIITSNENLCLISTPICFSRELPTIITVSDTDDYAAPGDPGKAFNIVMLSYYHHSFKRKIRFEKKWYVIGVKLRLTDR